MKKKSIDGQPELNHHRPKKTLDRKFNTGYIVLGISVLGLIGYQVYKRRNGSSNETLIASALDAAAPPIAAQPTQRPKVILSFKPNTSGPRAYSFNAFLIQVFNNRKERTESELLELAGDLAQIYSGAEIKLLENIDALKEAIQSFLDSEENMTSREAFEQVYAKLKMVMDNSTLSNITWKYGLNGINSSVLR